MTQPHWSLSLKGQEKELAVADLVDRGDRFDDILWLTNGWSYKIVGSLHPNDAWLVEPDWGLTTSWTDEPEEAEKRLGPSRVREFPRRGLAKVREHRWPDGEPVERCLPAAYSPLHGRWWELAQPSDIAELVLPESVVQRTLAAPSNENELFLARMCEDMLERSGLPSSAIGIKGSIARGLSIEGSDFDFGIYGLDNAICLVDAISRALSIPNSGWRRRWPPPEDSNLYALYTSSYSDLTLPEMWVGFEENGRDIFNFTFLDRDVSLYFHPDRFQRAHWPNVKGVELGEPETFTGTFGRQADLYHLDTPAFVQLSEVTTDKGEDLGEVTVSSWSRGFQYGTEGDRVRFVARKTNSPQVLVIPDFGVNWPIRILDL